LALFVKPQLPFYWSGVLKGRSTIKTRGANAMDEIEKRVIGKVMRRLIPFLILCYFVA